MNDTFKKLFALPPDVTTRWEYQARAHLIPTRVLGSDIHPPTGCARGQWFRTNAVVLWEGEESPEQQDRMRSISLFGDPEVRSRNNPSNPRIVP